MLEARSFLKDLSFARKILAEHNAVFKGEYEIHNFIFAPKNPTKTLSDEFLRLRLIPKNIWEEKSVVVAIKQTELKNIGKNSTILLKKEFDTEAEARAYIEENLLDKFVYDFEYSCIGWQYNMGDDQVDLEEIEGLYSIEVKSITEEGIKHLVDVFNLKNVIIGPTVVAVKRLLNK